jgi:CRP-like cAMP-binding protein
MKILPLGKSLDKPILVKAGTILFTENETVNYLLALKTGKVLLLKNSGQRLIAFKYCEEKEFINEVSILTNSPSEFTAMAKTDIELIVFEQKDILSVIKNGPSWIPQIFNTLCTRLKSTMEIINEHQLASGEKSSDLNLTSEEEKKIISAIDLHQKH